MNFAPECIGVGKYTTQLAAYLAGRGHRVEVVTAKPHYPAWRVSGPGHWRVTSGWEEGVRVTRCPLFARPGGRIWRLVAPLSFALAAAPVVLWRCLVFRPHVVLCVEPTLMAAPAALAAAAAVGARTALHVQDLEIDAAFATGHLTGGLLRRMAFAAERRLLRRFDAVVTISDAMAARLGRRGVAPARLSVLRNWIDAAPAEAVPDGAVAGLLPTGRRTVLYAGALGHKQGLSVLVEAARRLRGRTDLHLLVVGDGPMAPALRAAAASLPNMTVAGLQPAARLAALLAGADCHVLPQERAAGDLVFPSKLGPILASGRPCVVTGDPTHEIGRWTAGAVTLVPPGDGRALAEALGRQLERATPHDPSLGRTLAASLQAATVLPGFERVLLPAPRPQRSEDLVWAPAGSAFQPAG